MTKLILLDAYAIIYRSYYALLRTHRASIVRGSTRRPLWVFAIHYMRY